MLVSKLHGKLVSIFWTFSISCCSVVMLIFLSLLVFLGVGLLGNYHVVFYFSLLFDRYVGVSPQSKGFLVVRFSPYYLMHVYLFSIVMLVSRTRCFLVTRLFC